MVTLRMLHRMWRIDGFSTMWRYVWRRKGYADWELELLRK